MSHLPTRRVGQPRAGRPIRRSSAGLSRTRALAALFLVLAGLAIYGVGTSPVFAFRGPIDLEGATWTSPADVNALLAISDGTNLVTLRTDDLVARLAALPAVSSALATRPAVSAPSLLVAVSRVKTCRAAACWAGVRRS